MKFTQWTSSYPTLRRPTLAANVVSTSQPLAAQAGLRMLLAGGNAVDAALGAAIALTVVEPISNGIGSDLFAIVWDGRAIAGLNASGRSPAAWTPGYFAGRKAVPARGWDSVSVPGSVSAWAELSQRYGRLAFEKLFEPAIEYAADGYLISPFVARRWAVQVAELKDQPGFARYFLPGGRAPGEGERFAMADAARSLESIARTRGRSFYDGELAERIEAHAKEHGGALRRADLAAHTNDWAGTLTQDYRGFTVHEIPPNGQGMVCLMALGILSHFDLAALPVDGADSVHLQMEAVKLAFADARRYLGDWDAMTEVTPARLLEPAYLASRASLIDLERAQDFGHGTPPRGGTIYLTAADAGGMMVSLIQSNYMGFGSGVVVPGTGISLQNRGAGFNLQPGHPNCVAPRKRPYHTIIPGFVTRDGAAVMSFGLMGGTMQPQGHTQLVVRMADYGQNPQSAIDAPRFRVMSGLDVNLERYPEATLRALAQRGHRLVELAEGYMDFGCAQIALRVEGGYVAASDPRRDSLAVGF